MPDTLNEALEALKNPQAGWVTRRDAAELLGKVARKTVAVLESHRDDADVDVRKAVQEALDRIDRTQSAAQESPSEPDTPPTLDALARSCAKRGEREVTAEGKGYCITVALPEGRAQRVYLNETARADRPPLLCVQTRCGTPDERTKLWALRSNAKLSHCAFALRDDGGREELLLVNNIDLRLATPDGVKAAVKEMAFYGDWIEHKLSGLDEL
ncbi:MAG: hypothetical protein GC168_21595 [Candidatus Hydrogenedens sp.]|nr:hypothetical protein [Candidatus Hydrogenedens sp.]